ncbi:MAG TPA: PTS fructose transporter subunit IIB [Clostridiaceae bacterium]|nr:PTS fructose transporter subunit IIB [Clostridiaceae bacterium]
MKIIAVTACPAGVAHTYMAKKALEDAAAKLGHTIKVEAQGAFGIENEITQKEVADADVVILAVAVGIAKTERFKGKLTVNIPINTAIKSPENLIKKIEEKFNALE